MLNGLGDIGKQIDLEEKIHSASKGMAELAIRTYVESFFRQDSNLRIGITRAGNVIGGGDWAKDRIVPDCIRAWSTGKSVDIRSLMLQGHGNMF